MGKIVNITDKLNNEKPQIQVGEKVYEVDNSMATVLKFEELATVSTMESLTEAVEVALGKAAAKELKITAMSLGNFKVLVKGIMAAMQEIDYADADARFQGQK